METEQKNRACAQRYRELLPGVSDYVDHWAKRNPKGIAIQEFSTGESVTWKDLSKKTKAFSAKLLAMGLKKGDVIATSLPLLKEHVYIIFACFRIGAIAAPLDLRLKEEEVDRYFKKIKPKAYFFLGKTPVADFRPLVTALFQRYRDEVRHWIQFQKETDLLIPGVVGISEFAADIKRIYLLSILTGSVRCARRAVGKRDPAVIVFTTGSTGEPKPAVICHENILVQCIGMVVAFDVTERDRMLVNLPPSHVGCLTEQLAMTVYAGGTCIILPVYKADDSLRAIEKYQATMLGQIPAMYNMQWLLADYSSYDLTSLRIAVYGGQSVSSGFLEKLSRMAPRIGSGLGLTETAGFCTYTPLHADAAVIQKSLGFCSPLCPITIREPIGGEGTAGGVKAPGEVGEVCFEGPQVFLGYLNDEMNTHRTISKEGICYTGDMGNYDEQGLHLSGRRKEIIKPKGYQVFPGDVENFLAAKLGDRVTSVACVGALHELFSEAIIAFIEVSERGKVTVEEIFEIGKGLAAYARPSHVEILPPGGMPLNRVAKTDYLILKKRAEEIVSSLRESGGWDRSHRNSL
jgi:fatty-acyl-CoA synthase